MSIAIIVLLAVIQGLAELLPVSSSAHVIAAERLMGLDPSSPEMTFLLVMLHTGTMFAVILYFWPRWRARASALDAAQRRGMIQALFWATAATGAVGLALKHLIEQVALKGADKREIEALFANMPLIAAALAAAGLLIIWAGAREEGDSSITVARALRIGIVQGICLPFRGFSRSGATISTALLCGIPRAAAEDFSFALVVILTPAVIAKEAHRLARTAASGSIVNMHIFVPGLLGMAFSFLAGLGALRWLSRWLENGRWRYFGYYCLAASASILVLASR